MQNRSCQGKNKSIKINMEKRGEKPIERERSVKLTSLDLIRYRTMRPLNAANVWLSKSGEFIPVYTNDGNWLCNVTIQDIFFHDYLLSIWNNKWYECVTYRWCYPPTPASVGALAPAAWSPASGVDPQPSTLYRKQWFEKNRINKIHGQKKWVEQ